jgi:hypothetical protein
VLTSAATTALVYDLLLFKNFHLCLASFWTSDLYVVVLFNSFYEQADPGAILRHEFQELSPRRANLQPQDREQ